MNQFIYGNKTEYLLQSQQEKIDFSRYNLNSQLQSVQKRSAALIHDMTIYLVFVFTPIVLSLISFVIAFLGNIILRVLFVPILFIGIGSLFLLTPFGLYKLCMNGLMYFFGKHSGSITLFGQTFTPYTYKMEENYCLGKLQKLNDYEKQLREWGEALENGEEVPDFQYMEHYCDTMDLDFKIKVAVLDDPILKRFGKPLFILSVIVILAIGIATFGGAYIKSADMAHSNILGTDVLEDL